MGDIFQLVLAAAVFFAGLVLVLCAEDAETLQADATAPQAYGTGGNVAAANYYPSQECYNVLCPRQFTCVALPEGYNGYRRPYCVRQGDMDCEDLTDQDWDWDKKRDLTRRQNGIFGPNGNNFGPNENNNYGPGGSTYNNQVPLFCSNDYDCNRHTNNYYEFAYSCCYVSTPGAYGQMRCIHRPKFAV